jgi:hypothetical protein
MDSPELQSVEAFVAMMRRVLDDVMARPVRHTTGDAPPDASTSDPMVSLDVTSFRQTWPDASCGFGGIAAQVLTDAQTVVVSAPDKSLAVSTCAGSSPTSSSARTRRSGTPCATAKRPARRPIAHILATDPRFVRE